VHPDGVGYLTALHHNGERLPVHGAKYFYHKEVCFGCGFSNKGPCLFFFGLFS
jgi:hypothetical protein